MKHLHFFFLFVLGTSLHAQIKLGIGTELPGKMAVAVDSFWVEPASPSTTWGLSLPTKKAQIQVAYLQQQDTIWLNRTIDVPESGTYYYALVQIPTGALRLRLRSNPSWSSNLQFTAPVNKHRIGSREALVAAEPQVPAAEVPPVPATAQPADNLPQKTDTVLVAPPVALEEPKDTLPVVQEQPPVAPSPSAYFLALAEIKSTQFEFERIQKAGALAARQQLTTEQLVEVLQTFRFDQSKLDVIKRLPPGYKARIDWERIKSLLEYQTSKTLLEQWNQQKP